MEFTIMTTEVLRSSSVLVLAVCTASSLVTTGFTINFDFVSSFEDAVIMRFVFAIIALPFAGNLWEYYQVRKNETGQPRWEHSLELER